MSEENFESNLGFFKLRSIDLKKIDESRGTIIKSIWNWFGNHGCFIGGIPFTKSYTPAGLTDPILTPFERLYFIHQGKDKAPLIAVRMKPRNGGKLHDPTECLPQSDEYDSEDVTIYYLYSKEMCPEPEKDIPELDIIKKYNNILRLV